MSRWTVWRPPAWLSQVNPPSLPKWQQALQVGSLGGDTDEEIWCLAAPGPLSYISLNQSRIYLCFKATPTLFWICWVHLIRYHKAWLFGDISDAVNPEEWGLMVPGWVPRLLQSLLLSSYSSPLLSELLRVNKCKKPSVLFRGKANLLWLNAR